MRIYDATSEVQSYHFDFSVRELATKLNKASSDYFIKSRGLSEVSFCKSPDSYTQSTVCLDTASLTYKRCGWHQMTVYDEELDEQVDSSHSRCRPELVLIDVQSLGNRDSIKMKNDFGIMLLVGDSDSSMLYTLTGLKVKAEECLSESKQAERTVREFEKNIIVKISGH